MEVWNWCQVQLLRLSCYPKTQLGLRWESSNAHADTTITWHSTRRQNPGWSRGRGSSHGGVLEGGDVGSSKAFSSNQHDMTIGWWTMPYPTIPVLYTLCSSIHVHYIFVIFMHAIYLPNIYTYLYIMNGWWWWECEIWFVCVEKKAIGNLACLTIRSHRIAWRLIQIYLAL